MIGVLKNLINKVFQEKVLLGKYIVSVKIIIRFIESIHRAITKILQ